MPLIDCEVPPARCVGTGADARSSARRLLHGTLAVSAHVAAEAQAALQRIAPLAVGRVTSGGAWAEDSVQVEVLTHLAAVLPAELASALRPRFEWYACQGAFFHNDAHYGGVLFGAWCVSGPAREIVFARLGRRVPAATGHWVVFDPFEPHAVLDPGLRQYEREHYAQAQPSVFLGFELELSPAVRRFFGIDSPPERGPLLSSQVGVNAETGVLS